MVFLSRPEIPLHLLEATENSVRCSGVHKTVTGNESKVKLIVEVIRMVGLLFT